MLKLCKNNLLFFGVIASLAIILNLYFSTESTTATSTSNSNLKPFATIKSAIILQYHHIADDTPNATSTSVALFKQQMELLKTLDFQVLPLTKVMNGLKSGKTLPARTVALTFDDAYNDFLTNAWPILQDYGYPATLFVATTHISDEATEFLSWPQLRQLVKQGVEIGSHSHSHNYLARELYTNPETIDELRRDIELSLRLLKLHLSIEITFFAYPYGEYTLSFAQLIKQMRLIGFGQHSGPINGTSSLNALPRFPASNDYGQIKDLSEKLFTRPFENFTSDPTEPFTQNSRPRLKLVFSDSSLKVNCYASSQGEIPIASEIKGSKLVVLARVKTAIVQGRSRYNCTAPTKGNYFFWFSQPWVHLEKISSIQYFL